MIVDAWAQHPTPQFLRHPMFESLWRWTGAREVPDRIPLELTTGAMEAAGVDRALVCAWWGPGGPLISNGRSTPAAQTTTGPKKVGLFWI